MNIWRFDMLLFDNKDLFSLLIRNLLKVTSADCCVPALSISLSHCEPGRLSVYQMPSAVCLQSCIPEATYHA